MPLSLRSFSLFSKATDLVTTLASSAAKAGTMCFAAPNETPSDNTPSYEPGVANFSTFEYHAEEPVTPPKTTWGIYELNCTSDSILTSIADGVVKYCNGFINTFQNYTFNCRQLGITSPVAQQYVFFPNNSASTTPVCYVNYYNTSVLIPDGYPNSCVMNRIQYGIDSAQPNQTTPAPLVATGNNIFFAPMLVYGLVLAGACTLFAVNAYKNRCAETDLSVVERKRHIC